MTTPAPRALGPWWRWSAAILGIGVLLVIGRMAESQRRYPNTGQGAPGPAGPAGTFDQTTAFWSSVDMWKRCVDSSGNANPPAIGSAQEKDGLRFYFTRAATITGVRFYWPGPARTVRALLHQAHAGTLLTSVDVVVSGTGDINATFATPVAATPYVHYSVSIFEVSSSNNLQPCAPNGANAANNGILNYPFSAGGFLVVTNQYYCGGACATSNASMPNAQLGTANIFPVEPRYTIP